MAFTLLKPTGIDLSQTFAFTGSVTGDNAGDLVHLATSTSTGATAEIQFDNVFTSSYRIYKVIGFCTPENDDVNLQLRARTGGSSGSTHTSGDYHWGHFTLNANLNGTGQTTDNHDINTSYWRLGDQINLDNKNSVYSFDLTFYDPITTVASMCYYSGTVTFDTHNPSACSTGFVGGKMRNASIDITGLHFYWSSGDITCHATQIYGLKQ